MESRQSEGRSIPPETLREVDEGIQVLLPLLKQLNDRLQGIDIDPAGGEEAPGVIQSVGEGAQGVVVQPARVQWVDYVQPTREAQDDGVEPAGDGAQEVGQPAGEGAQEVGQPDGEEAQEVDLQTAVEGAQEVGQPAVKEAQGFDVQPAGEEAQEVEVQPAVEEAQGVSPQPAEALCVQSSVLQANISCTPANERAEVADLQPAGEETKDIGVQMLQLADLRYLLKLSAVILMITIITVYLVNVCYQELVHRDNTNTVHQENTETIQHTLSYYRSPGCHVTDFLYYISQSSGDFSKDEYIEYIKELRDKNFKLRNRILTKNRENK